MRNLVEPVEEEAAPELGIYKYSFNIQIYFQAIIELIIKVISELFIKLIKTTLCEKVVGVL